MNSSLYARIVIVFLSLASARAEGSDAVGAQNVIVQKYCAGCHSDYHNMAASRSSISTPPMPIPPSRQCCSVR